MMVSTSRAVRSEFSRMNVTAAGSMEPQRVPMIRPSSGVKPIVVSTTRPSRTAHSEEPLPKWQLTSLPASPPNSSFAVRET